MGTEPIDYCRQIETYLCQKNDGHIVRIVGPAFELVSGWADKGVPLKIACQGIDRSFERYYRKGPRRRPVRVEFCDADVLDAFDEWRRAVLLPADGARPLAAPGDLPSAPDPKPSVSLPAHLERVLLRLSSARADGRLGEAFDELIDEVAREFEAAKAKASGVRGATRQALIERLSAIDARLMGLATASLKAAQAEALRRSAEEELSVFRTAMPSESYAKARERAVERLVREQLGLPTVSWS